MALNHPSMISGFRISEGSYHRRRKFALTFKLFRPILRSHLAAGSMDPVTSLSVLDLPASPRRLDVISGHSN